MTASSIHPDTLRTVGRAPLLKRNRVTACLDATVALKCEFFNPPGNVKDRIGAAMILAAALPTPARPGSGISSRLLPRRPAGKSPCGFCQYPPPDQVDRLTR